MSAVFDVKKMTRGTPERMRHLVDLLTWYRLFAERNQELCEVGNSIPEFTAHARKELNRTDTIEEE